MRKSTSWAIFLFDRVDGPASLAELAPLFSCQFAETLCDSLARVGESFFRRQTVAQLIEKTRTDNVLSS